MKRLAMVLFLVAVVPVTASAQFFMAQMSGTQEVPPADLDGTGIAFVTISGTTVTYSITVNNITLPPIAQHIHQAPAGVNGPIVVNLPGTWVGNTLSGTTTTDAATAAAIIANPAGFYVNVHTTDFPGGAVRGQLFTPSNVPTLSTWALALMGVAVAMAGVLWIRR